MYMTSHNFDDWSINLEDPIIIAAETSQKDNIHFGEAIKSDDSEYFMKTMRKEITYLNTADVW